MDEPLQKRVLAWLKVPPAPRPPAGDPASLQIFRAGRNYYRLRMTAWLSAQLLALAGIIFWTTMLFDVESIARNERAATRTNEPAMKPAPANPSSAGKPADGRRPQEKWIEGVARKLAGAGKTDGGGWAGFKRFFVEIAVILPPWAFPLIWGLKIFSFAVYLLQIPITYTVRRLDYEMRWYMVTDRSLRLRHGVWKIVESTMSFANVQEVVMSQGPVQRLLGLADVRVKSAGGGGEKQGQPGEDMHVGIFHCVTNAPEIRNLILERLRRFRESGLGDPDEPVATSAAVSPALPVGAATDALEAARELAAEARALRIALS